MNLFKLLLIFTASFLISFVFLTLMAYANTVEDELDCLAEAVYFEARSEPFVAQIAVGNVIYNRVMSNKFPNTFCGVVHQSKRNKQGKLIKHRCQFSYYCDGKEENMYDYEAYELSKRIAQLVIKGVIIDSIRGATHYHANYVKPKWSLEKKYLGEIGLHKFYK